MLSLPFLSHSFCLLLAFSKNKETKKKDKDNEILVFSRVNFLMAVGNTEAIFKGTAEKL